MHADKDEFDWPALSRTRLRDVPVERRVAVYDRAFAVVCSNLHTEVTKLLPGLVLCNVFCNRHVHDEVLCVYRIDYVGALYCLAQNALFMERAVTRDRWLSALANLLEMARRDTCPRVLMRHTFMYEVLDVAVALQQRTRATMLRHYDFGAHKLYALQGQPLAGSATDDDWPALFMC